MVMTRAATPRALALVPDGELSKVTGGIGIVPGFTDWMALANWYREEQKRGPGKPFRGDASSNGLTIPTGMA